MREPLSAALPSPQRGTGWSQVWYGNGEDDDDDDDAGTGSDIMLSGQLGRSTSACVSLCVTFSLLPPSPCPATSTGY